ncbi:MAG: nucleotidyltransferase family protein [Anaerolineae bacterium]
MLLPQKTEISAIVVAAGLSTRMGEPKQLLPYGQHTVIEQIVSVLRQCALLEVVVITGHQREAVEAKLTPWPVRVVFNPNYQAGEMLSSIQCGLLALNPAAQAALIVLGDQPQLEATVVRQVIEAYQAGLSRLIIPSFQMRRGHPILLDRAYWPEILDLSPGDIRRPVITAHADMVYYVLFETDAVLRDMDTPEEYQQELSRRGLETTIVSYDS